MSAGLLRRLAAQRLAQEKPGQTLQATALVHEAYLRLVRQLAAAAFVEVHRYPGRGLEVTLSDLSGGGVP